jgi:protein-S-isoprenylcysteine O-methyltransferase Ste14
MKQPLDRSFNTGLALIGTLAVALITLLLLLLAGRLSYWQGWVFAGVNEALVITMAALFSTESRAIRERMRFTAASIWWDRLFLALFMPANLAVVVLAVLDAGRMHIGPEPPPYLYPLCYLVYMGAAYLHLRAVSSNNFYVGAVSVKEGQHVSDRGPYRWVRHPGYAGIILMMPCIALVLGSFVALIPAGIIALLVVGRTALEDRLLRNELEGYTEYADRVRYRLIPWIW